MIDWKDGKLTDVAKIIMGQSPKGETYNTIGNGLPLLNGPTEFGIKNPSPTQYTTNAKRKSKINDLLFCVRGSTGKMNWSDKEYAIGRGIAGIRHKNGQEYKFFLKGIIDYNLPLLLQSATGSTFSNVSKNQLEELEIQIPPLPEQRAIASVLSSLDDKIDLLHRQNKTLEAMAETLYESWISYRKYESTIKDLVNIQNGFAFKSKSFQSIGTHRVLKIKNISGGIVDIQNTAYISEYIASDIDNRFNVKTGDILFAMTGAKIGKMGIIPQTDNSLWLNQRVGLLKEKYNGARFLAYLHLKSDFGFDYIKNTATGSAQPNISSKGIEGCEFPRLNQKEIIEYSNEFLLLFKKLFFNLGQIRTLSNLRDTLLPKLMSGEIRIAIDE